MSIGEPVVEVEPEQINQEYSGGHRKAEVTVDDSFPCLPSTLPIRNPEDLAYAVSYEQKIQVMNPHLLPEEQDFIL